MGFKVKVGTAQSELEAAILASLPKIEGHYMAPQYCPSHLRRKFENEIIEWCATRPRRRWPDFIEDWINADASRGAEVDRRFAAARPDLDLARV